MLSSSSCFASTGIPPRFRASAGFSFACYDAHKHDDDNYNTEKYDDDKYDDDKCDDGKYDDDNRPRAHSRAVLRRFVSE